MNFSIASSSQHQPRKNISKLDTGGDMISSLPDDLLVHILSFLPTTIAFSTSVLSTRWQYLWTLVPILNFSLYRHRRTDPDSRFTNFIEMILLSHSKNVKRFFIEYPGEYDCSRLYAWINVLLKQNIQDVKITGYGMNLRLPGNFFICKTLVTLKLDCLQLSVPSSVNFPCLKIMFICIATPNRDLTERLFCSAPVLEELDIFVYADNGAKIYNIDSPCLKKLSVNISTVCIKDFDIKVIVDAPALETLDILDSCFAHYVVKNLSSLVKASIIIEARDLYNKDLGNKFISENLIMLLKSVSNVKDLSLASSYPLAAFGSIYESRWPVFANTARLELEIIDDYDPSSFSRWPLFPNLRHMVLLVGKDFASKNLSDLLALAPNLISLEFVKVSYRDRHGQFNSSEQRIPSCFRSCLSEIGIGEIDGLESELNVIKYLLENAQILEKMTIKVAKSLQSVDKRKVEDLKSEILMMPKCSKQVELVFI